MASDRFHDEPKAFVEHLDDLRRTVMGMLIAWGASTLIAIPLCPLVIAALRHPVAWAGFDPTVMLKPFDATDGMAIVIRTTMWTGFAICLPILIFFAVRFVFPGLKARERKWLARLSAAAGLLFLAGVAMGYFVTLPIAIQVLLRMNSWVGLETDFIRASGYLALAIKLLAAFGLAFELPVLLLVLGLLGLVDSKMLREKRRHVIVGIFILAMILTPPDPVTQVMMGAPMIVLYEICIWIIHFRERAQKSPA